MPRIPVIFIVSLLLAGLGVLFWLSRQPSPAGSVPGEAPSFPMPRVLVPLTLDQITSMTFRHEQRRASFECVRPPMHVQPMTGSWLVKWPGEGASPAISWPASSPAIESNFRTLSGIAGREAAMSRGMQSVMLGTATFARSGGADVSFSMLASGFGGVPLAKREEKTFALSADPAAIFDESTWQGMTTPLVAPLFGREVFCMTVSDGTRTLMLQRVHRQWEVSIHHTTAAGTAPLPGDLASCEGLAKVLTEAMFESVSPGRGVAVEATHPDSKPAATVTLYRRAGVSDHPLERVDMRVPAHRATLELFRKGEVDATTLSVASTVELVDAVHPPTILGPVHGKVDPALLRHLGVFQWPFVSRLALEFPAADVTRVEFAGRTYSRPVLRWQASPASADPELDTRLRGFLMLLSLVPAESVAAAPSQMPADAVSLRLEVPQFKRAVTLEIAISPGQVLIREGVRGLTYTTPSAVAEITSFVRRTSP